MNLSFKDYLDDYIKDEETPENGTYACINLSEHHTKKLAEWLADNKDSIANPIDHEMHPFHATLMFSRNILPTLKDEEVKLPILARGSEWKILPQPNRSGDALVLVLRTDGVLEELHDRFMELPNATYDFDSFIPHVTVSTRYNLPEVPKVKPNFGLVFDEFMVEPLRLKD
jgi:hypothetical protein